MPSLVVPLPVLLSCSTSLAVSFFHGIFVIGANKCGHQNKQKRKVGNEAKGKGKVITIPSFTTFSPEM
jgi:hypothetical protein